MVLVCNHQHLFKAIYVTESKGLKSFLVTIVSNVESSVAKGSISGPPCFNIFMICSWLISI